MKKMIIIPDLFLLKAASGQSMAQDGKVVKHHRYAVAQTAPFIGSLQTRQYISVVQVMTHPGFCLGRARMSGVSINLPEAERIVSYFLRVKS